MNLNKPKRFKIRSIAFILAVTVATVFAVQYLVHASSITTTIGANISTSGTLTVGGASLFSSLVNASSTFQVTGTSTFYAGLNVQGVASSTFANGISLTSGCYALPDGSCAGAAGGTVGAGTTGQIAFYSSSGSVISATSSIFIGTTTNVGIASTSPWGTFSVEMGTTSPAFVVSNQGSTTPSLFIGGVNQNGYVGIGTSSPDQALTVVGNISNYPIAPVSVGSASLSTTSSNLQKSTVYVSGQFAYLVNDGEGFLRVFDISTSSPAQVAQVALAGDASAVYVSNQLAYVINYCGTNGTTNCSNAASQLQIFDVSNPANPSLVGSMLIDQQSSDIIVSGHYAYVPSDVASESLQIIDVTNPVHPFLVSKVNHIRFLDSENGARIFFEALSGRYLYLPDYNNNRLQVFDVSNPYKVFRAGQTQFASGSSPTGIAISGKYAFVTDFGLSTLQVFDISTTTPALISTISTGTGINTKPWAIKISGRYAFVTTWSSAGSGAIQIYDISNPLAPHQVGSTQVGSGVYPEGVFVSGRYIYVANGIAPPNLQVFDIGGLETPSALIHSLQTGYLQVTQDLLTQGELEVNGGLQIGNSGILSSGPLSISATTSSSDILGGLVIGTTTPATTSPNYLPFAQSTLVVEATSTGTVPLTLRGFSGQAANLFQIQNATSSNVFVVTGNNSVGIGTSTPNEKLSVVGNVSNILDSNLTTLKRTGSAQTTGGNPYALFVQGKYGYSVNQSPGVLDVYDLSTSSPALVNAVSLSASSPFSIFVSGRYAYIASNDATYTFQIFDISNVRNIYLVSYFSGALQQQAANDVYVSGKYAYITTDEGPGINDTFQVLDVSDPTNPQEVSLLHLGVNENPLSALGMDVSGHFVFVADTNNDFKVINVSDPLHPFVTSTTATGASTLPDGIAVSGRYAYVSLYTSQQLQIYDISDPTSPTLLKTVSTGAGTGPAAVRIAGRYLYVAAFDGSQLLVFDVSDPLDPIQVNSLTTDTTPEDLRVFGKKAYVLSQGSGANKSLQIYDVSGLETTSATIHSLRAGNLAVETDISAQGQLQIGGGVNVGDGGILSSGPLTVSATTAPSVFLDSVGIGTTTPGATLAVQGNALVSGTLTVANLIATGTQTFAGVTTFQNGFISQASSTISSGNFTVTGGNVGIGTSSPMATLSISGNLALNGCVKSATTTVDLGSDSCLDIAESYFAGENLEPGDVVAFDPNNSLHVIKAAIGASSLSNLAGVVSTAPAILFENNLSSFGGSQSISDLYLPESKVPLALAGRIPTKVNLVGGNIQIGDAIAPSSVPGEGQKAVAAGQIIGYALENYSGPTPQNNGKILVFANLGYWSPAIPAATAGNSGDNSPSLLSSVIDTVQNWLQSLGVWIENGLVRLRELVAEKITTQQLCVGDTCINQDQFKTLLNTAGIQAVLNAASSNTGPTETSTPAVETSPTDSVNSSSSTNATTTP